MTPAPALVSSSLSIRPFAEMDVGDAYLSWLNDPEVTRYSNQRFRRHDRESALAYLQSFEGSPNLFLLIGDRESGKPIGTLTVYISEQHGTADMGIMIGDRSMWGKGHGQEAWDLVMSWLLDMGIRKVTAGTSSRNLGMQRIAQRSGMELEGRRRAQELIEGEPADILLYGRLAHA